MKVVIADDSSLMRDRIKKLLAGTEENVMVFEAENGDDAIQSIRENKPDLVILDIRMPGMNGIEVLKRIKEDNTKIIVCILTNYPFQQYRQKCIELGADYFFDKNLEFEKILDLVNKTTAEHKASWS
jgi:DNA-binding NarL/FixJ family response regulator